MSLINMPEGHEFANIDINRAGSVHLGNTYIIDEDSGSRPTVDALLADLFLTDTEDDLTKTRSLKGKRVPRTCEWLLKRVEFEKWATTKESNDLELLWLIGAPGIGKTVFSCFLIECLQAEARENDSVILAYYLCYSQDDQRNSATAVLRGVLGQLLKKRPDLFSLVKEDYKLKKAGLVGNLYSLWGALVRVLKSCNRDKVYILIDALDECDESSRKELLALIGSLESSVKARILITARPEADIEDTAHEVGVSLRIDSAKINDDLSKFINTRINELQKKKDYPTKLVDDIRTTLQEKAGGTFLWASLVLQDIGASRTAKAARKKLNSLPRDLTDVYKRILENINEDVDDAVFILQWVVISRRPMTKSELATAQALEAWDGDNVPPAEVLEELEDGFKACGPLLYHDPDTDTINLVHQSAKDYLVHTNCLPKKYRVDKQEASLSLLGTCWRYLGMQDFACGAVIVSRNEANELAPRRLTKRIGLAYAFLTYATEELRDAGLDERLDLVNAFIRQRDDLDSLPLLRDFWLLRFTLSGHLEGISALLERHADANVREQGAKSWTVLHHAILDGRNDVAMLLLDNGADANAVDADGNTALHLAARQGFLEVCRRLIELRADVDAKTIGRYGGKTALHLAAEEGHSEVVDLLLNRGASIDGTNKEGNTPLLAAVRNRREDLALLLLERGAGIDVGGFDQSALSSAAAVGCDRIVRLLLDGDFDVNQSGPLLQTAVSCGRLSTVQMLVARGADLKRIDEYHGCNLLHLAAEEGHRDILQLLIQKGLDINALFFATSNVLRGDSKYALPKATVLFFAAARGDSETVKLLLKEGADFSIPAEKGQTPLHIAATNGHSSIVQALLSAGASGDGTDDLGRTALHRAARHGHQETVNILLEHGTNVKLGDINGWTALHHAADKRCTNTVLLLLSKGDADINALDTQGRTSLHIVSEMVTLGGSKDRKLCAIKGAAHIRRGLVLNMQRRGETIKQLLIERGADIEIATNAGLRPLHLAACSCSRNITDLLLQRCVEINAKDESGKTALHWTAAKQFGSHFNLYGRNAYEDVASLLLQNGADINARDKTQRTPLFGAALRKHRRMCYILLQHGADAYTMGAQDPGTEPFPKVNQLTRTVRQWRSQTDSQPPFNPSDSENGYKSLEYLQKAGEVLSLLFEMAAYIAEAADLRGPGPTDGARNGYDTVVSRLLKKDSDISVPNSAKIEALEAAAKAGNEPIVSTWIQYGVDINASSALVRAVEEGHERVIQLLLEKGADLRIRHSDFSPILAAGRHGQAQIIELLLDAGADISDYNYGGTALHWAASNGYLDAARVLLERGAPIHESPGHGAATPLVKAIRGRHKAVVQLLLMHGADANFEYADGCRPLHDALEQFSTDEIVPLLIKYGADPKTANNPSLLSWAMNKGREATLGLLELEGCLDVAGRDGQALYTWAVEEGHKDIIGRLLELGVEISVPATEML